MRVSTSPKRRSLRCSANMCGAAAVVDAAQFITIYATLAAQRASKILGIFARLDMRDGKPQYLRHLPRVWGYLQRALSHPALEALNAWYIAHVPSLNTI